MKKLLVLIILFVMIPVSASQADVISLPAAVHDSALTTDNWGTMTIQSNQQRLWVWYDGNNQARAAAEFDIKSIPTSSTILSAYFDIWGIITDANIGLHGYSGDGSISAGDFTLSNEITQFDPVSGSSPLLNHVDVTTFISGLIKVGQPYAGFQLRELVENEFNEFVGDYYPDYQPQLMVEYTPSTPVTEPATMLLLGLGLVGLAGVRRRFNK